MTRLNSLMMVALCIGNSSYANEVSQERKPCPMLCNLQEESRYFSIDQLDENSIDYAKKMIACEIKHNAVVRTGIQAAGTFAALYVFYKMFIERDADQSIALKRSHELPGSLVPVRQINLEERLKMLEEESAATTHAWNKLLADTNPNWFTWQWVKNWTSHIGKGLVSMAVTKGLFDFGERTFQSIFHEGNSQWFIATHTRLIETVQEFNEYAQKFDAMDDRVMCEHYAREIAFITNNLIKQCALVIGFIEYSIDVMPRESAEMLEGKTLAAYLRIITNDFAQRMQSDLNYRKNPITPIMNQFTAEFGRTMMSFARIEQPVK